MPLFSYQRLRALEKSKATWKTVLEIQILKISDKLVILFRDA